MEILVQSRSPIKRKFILGLTTLLAKELRIEDCKFQLIVMLKRGLRKTQGCNGVAGKMGKIIGVGVDSDLNMDKLMITLAHEMVHVKQLVRGTLRYDMIDGDEIVVWRGKQIDTSTMLYIDRPWEREAYSKQEILLRRISELIIDA